MAERELQDVVQRVTEESTALSGAQFGATELGALAADFSRLRRRDDLALLIARVSP
jgi:hypothetical protein